jgi:hypothetical protein
VVRGTVIRRGDVEYEVMAVRPPIRCDASRSPGMVVCRDEGRRVCFVGGLAPYTLVRKEPD